MTTISATWIRKPLVQRRCADCGKRIEGPVVRLYGHADDHTSPYVLYFHAGCLGETRDAKIRSILEKQP